ncbi:MAG: GNAT family N-acetyltransferase [Anaerolineales bacterium]
MKYKISPSHKADRRAIERITRATGAFEGDELAAPAELFDEYWENPDDPDGYRFLSCRAGGKTVGFACFGKADFTAGTYDLYWIAVHPEHFGSGAARALFASTIEAVCSEGGRLLMIWTSSRPDYARARRFYESVGCALEATIADFYRPGEAACIYSYRIDASASGRFGQPE